MTIADILTAFAAGTYDQELAEQLLQGLIEQEVRADRRSVYAAAALTGLLATGVRMPSIEDACGAARSYADAMVAGIEQPAQP